MKKKTQNISPAEKAAPDSRREAPYFCKVAATEAAALGGIALRAIMSGIPKQKSARGKAPEMVETTKKNLGEE